MKRQFMPTNIQTKNEESQIDYPKGIIIFLIDYIIFFIIGS